MEAIGLLIIRFVLAVFAVYRLARMVALEEGPFSLFDKLRDGAERIAPDTWLSRGFSCPYCVGWWLAFPAMLTVWEGVDYVAAFMLWAAIAGGAAYLQATEGEP